MSWDGAILPCLSIGLLTGAPVSARDDLKFVPRPGLERRKVFEIEFELGGGFRNEGARLTERLVIDERVLRVADGRAMRLSRTIVDLRGESSYELLGLAGTVTSLVMRDASPAEGATFVLDWDDEQRAYRVRERHGREHPSWVPGGASELELTGFLPPAPVVAGSSWKLAPSALDCLLRPGGRLPSRDGEQVEEHREALLRSLEGDVRATYLGERARTDGTYAVIWIDVEIKGRLRTTLSFSFGSFEWDSTMALDLEGELRWDLRSGRLHDLELTGRALLGGGSWWSTSTSLEGSVRLAVEVEEL